MGFFSLFVFFYAFSFTLIRGEFEHPWEKALELLLPAFVTALFLNYLGLPQIIVGFVAVIIFAVFTKKTLDLENKIWATETIKLFCLLGIFGSVDAWSRNILIIGLIVYNLIKSEKKLNDKEKEKNKEKPSKKKKSEKK